MKVVAKSDKGKVRNNNQDSYSTGMLQDNSIWAVVCDGMGGANGGNVASALAIRVISQQLTSAYNIAMSDNAIKNLLESVINAANAAIFEMAQNDTSLVGMGTTVVCTIIKNGFAYIAHAGDSRAYIISSNEIRQITKDHSIVQTLIDKGQLTQSEAREHPSKNIITRALGVANVIKVDFDIEEIYDKCSLLLCSDGLSNFINDNEIFEIFQNNKSYTYAEKLVNKANENGGGDNITAVVITNNIGE